MKNTPSQSEPNEKKPQPKKPNFDAAEFEEREKQKMTEAAAELLAEMKERSITPGTEEAAIYKDLWLRGGVEVNVALAQAALLDAREYGDCGIIFGTVSELDSAPMYKILDDQCFRSGDVVGSVSDDLYDDPELRKAARLFVAGMIAERNARRRRRQMRKRAQYFQDVSTGRKPEPNTLREELP